jgi:hypothetical protein
MKSWQPILERLSKAMDFANIDSLRELETLLEKRTEEEPVRHRTAETHAAPKPATYATSHAVNHGLILKLSENHR